MPVREPWYKRRWLVMIALATIYPAGLVLLWTRPTRRRWTKALVTVVFAPIFCIIVLLYLRPLWDFQGGMASWRDFSLDFGRLTQDRILESHRATQRAAVQEVASTQADGIAGAAWTDFRGSRRDGVVEDAEISLDWTKSPPRELYRQPIGGGYASFVVAAGRAYTIEQRRGQEAVTCYDFATGRELWAFAYPAKFSESLGGDGPRATPTLHDGRLFSLGAEGHLNCLDAAAGTLEWGKDILKEFGRENLSWGLAGSPLIVDGKVIVTGSGKGGASILALNAATGSLVWKADGGVQGYSSLVDAKLAGRRVLLNLAAASLNGLDSATGRILLSFPWPTAMGINCSQPLVVGDDRVFVSSGYGEGCALLKVTAAGNGLSAQAEWSNKSMKNKFNSSVIHKGFIYGLDEGILCCLDLSTGARRWKGGRYGYGSLLLVRGHLLVLSEDGALALAPADPAAWRELGHVQILQGRTWNNFVLVAGRLLARNHKEMVCYDLRPANTPTATAPRPPAAR